jgi:membrane protease YdiL (CAAX protease family)
MLALHLMAAVLALALPAWDYYEAKHLRTAMHPLARTRCYMRGIAGLWLATFAAVALMPFETLWNAPSGMRSMTGAASPDFVLVLVAALSAGLLAPLLLAYFHRGMRERIFEQLEEIDYMLPHSRSEIALFAGVSVTAGICEEVVFRGLLFAYLQASPWNLGPVATILVSSAMFGIAHLGQGFKGVLVTGTVGALLGILYVSTGSLLAPIIVHILIDLRATALCHLRATTRRQPA